MFSHLLCTPKKHVPQTKNTYPYRQSVGVKFLSVTPYFFGSKEGLKA